MNNTNKKVIYAALFAALCCIGTMVIQIPVPATQGIVHLGDAFVILSGVVLGPFYGFLAAGIGSALANLLAGHVIWAPATLLIKGGLALVSGLIWIWCKKHHKSRYIALTLAGVANMIMVALGYFLYGGAIVVGFPAAATGIPMDLLQGLAGLVLAQALFPILGAIPEIREFMAVKSNH